MNTISGPQGEPTKGTVRHALGTLFTGILTGLVTLFASASFASLIFSGPLAPFLPRGIGLMLFTAVTAGLIVSLRSSCRYSIAIPQDRIAPILALMATLIVATMPVDSTPEELFATVAVAIATTTLLTGLFLSALGLFRLGGLIRFLPHSVIGGFFAGTGWLLVLGGLGVMTGTPFDRGGQVAWLLHGEQLLKWLPGIGIALLIRVLARYLRHTVALPLTLLLATGGFFLLAAAVGMSSADLFAGGWLLGPFADVPSHLWHPISGAELLRVHWPAVADNIGSVGTVLLLSAVSILLTVSALELMARRELDVNRELSTAGLANLVSGLGGGMVAFHSLSFSSLVDSMGRHSRWVGIISVLVCLVGLWLGPAFLAYLPRPVLGGLLAFLGFTFLGRWLVKARTRLPRSEYAMILLILLVMVVFGFIEGMAAGLLTAVVLFVVNYSRVDVVRYAMSGAQRKSNAERHPTEERLLRENGDRTYVLKLQGYLFFGTIRKIQQYIEERVADRHGTPLQYVVLDFGQVTGIDSSATLYFTRFVHSAERHGFQLILTGLDAQSQQRLQTHVLADSSLSLLHFLPDLDHGLEWCENRILSGLNAARQVPDDSILRQFSSRLGQDAQKQAFMGYLEELAVPAGHYLVRQGEPSDDLYFVESGEVSVILETQNGETVRLRRTEPGTIVGEMGFYLGGTRSASATADQAATVYRLTADTVRRMEIEHPDVALAFHRFMAEFCAERLLRTTHTLEAMKD